MNALEKPTKYTERWGLQGYTLFFLLFLKTIDWRYSLEPFQWRAGGGGGGGSNEDRQSIFGAKLRGKNHQLSWNICHFYIREICHYIIKKKKKKKKNSQRGGYNYSMSLHWATRKISFRWEFYVTLKRTLKSILFVFYTRFSSYNRLPLGLKRRALH